MSVERFLPDKVSDNVTLRIIIPLLCAQCLVAFWEAGNMLRHKHLFVFLAMAPLLAHAQDARDPRDPRDPRDDPPVVETEEEEEEECVRSCPRIDAILDELPTIEARDTNYRISPLYSEEMGWENLLSRHSVINHGGKENDK